MTTETTAKTTLEVGDYLVASWGYDQTNATFYRVTKRTPKMVDLVEVQGQYHGDTLRLEPSETPVTEHDWTNCPMPEGLTYLGEREYHEENRGCFVTKTLNRKVQPAHIKSAESVRINSYKWASLYEGGGMFDTIAAGQPGH